MNAEISEIKIGRKLGLCLQILELPAKRKFVSAGCHAHSNAHNAITSLAPTFLKKKNGILFLLSIPIYMPKMIEIGPLIKKLLPNSNQYFAIQSRLHTTCSKSAVITNTSPSR